MLVLQDHRLCLRFLCARADQLPGLVRHMPPSLARPPGPDGQLHERMLDLPRLGDFAGFRWPLLRRWRGRRVFRVRARRRLRRLRPALHQPTTFAAAVASRTAAIPFAPAFASSSTLAFYASGASTVSGSTSALAPAPAVRPAPGSGRVRRRLHEARQPRRLRDRALRSPLSRRVDLRDRRCVPGWLRRDVRLRHRRPLRRRRPGQ